jgi:hypothetical protein
MLSDFKKINTEKCKDAGLALVLICLICYQVWGWPVLVLLSILFLLIAMSCPRLFKPFAIFWFSLSTTLGTVMSKVILSLLFFALVLPVGMLRRAFGKDPMRIKCWRKGHESVFRVRNHKFMAKDLKHPY